MNPKKVGLVAEAHTCECGGGGERVNLPFTPLPTPAIWSYVLVPNWVSHLACCLATSVDTESPRSLFPLEPITLRVLLGGGSEMHLW